MIKQSIEKFGPDWIMFDGTEDMSVIMEQVMRMHNNVSPYGGISNLNIWKERKQILDDIHAKSMGASKKGVIYTMYPTKDTIIDKDGIVIKSKDVPAWIGSVMKETDIVIHAESEIKDDKEVFFARIERSKIQKEYPSGKHNITGIRFCDKMKEVL